MNHPIITANEARACGITPSQLRATANSLERIARKGYENPFVDYQKEEVAYSSDTTRNAFALRRVAKELSR